MNDDTTVMDDFVQCLLEAALAPAPADVDRSIGDEADNAYLLSICASVDAWRLFTCDILETHTPQAVAAVVKVDALSGRRVLFPMAGLVGAGGLPPSALPHYLAGYEASVRMRNAGWRPMLLQPVAAYSDENDVSMYSRLSWRNELFYVRSPLYLLARLLFWWEASRYLQRLTLLLCSPMIILSQRLLKPA